MCNREQFIRMSPDFGGLRDETIFFSIILGKTKSEKNKTDLYLIFIQFLEF